MLGWPRKFQDGQEREHVKDTYNMTVEQIVPYDACRYAITLWQRQTCVLHNVTSYVVSVDGLCKYASCKMIQLVLAESTSVCD